MQVRLVLSLQSLQSALVKFTTVGLCEVSVQLQRESWFCEWSETFP